MIALSHIHKGHVAHIVRQRLVCTPLVCVHTRPMAAVPKSVHTAACLIPSEHLWKSIQGIRSSRDKAFERWPPHINLLYPFLDEDATPGAVDAAASLLVPVRSLYPALCCRANARGIVCFSADESQRFCLRPVIAAVALLIVVKLKVQRKSKYPLLQETTSSRAWRQLQLWCEARRSDHELCIISLAMGRVVMPQHAGIAALEAL